MGRHKDCCSGAARRSSCCHDTYFIRPGVCIVFLNRRCFISPSSGAKCGSKGCGKTDKGWPNGEAETWMPHRAGFSFQERAPEMMQISKCQHMLKKRAPCHAAATDTCGIYDRNYGNAPSWSSAAGFGGSIFSGSLNATPKFLLECQVCLHSVAFVHSCLLTCSTWTLSFSVFSSVSSPHMWVIAPAKPPCWVETFGTLAERRIHVGLAATPRHTCLLFFRAFLFNELVFFLFFLLFTFSQSGFPKHWFVFA